MHVALDASDLTTERWDGTTVYGKELLPRLAEVLAARGHTVTAYASGPLRVPFPAGKDICVSVVPGRRFWTQTVLSRALFRDTPDLLFLPIQTVPFYRPRVLKVIATVHDLDFLDFPETFTLRNRLLLRWFTRVVVRNATHLIAVSQATKDAILRHYRRPATDVTVVHHGVDQERFRPPRSPEEQSEAPRRLRQRYGIPLSPILFVGALQPRKNLHGLIAAFELLRATGREETLVIAGSHGWKEDIVRARVARSPVRQAIRIVGAVPKADLPALYGNASVFVLPSLAEGFGLPVLEAMACGTPVVTSRAPALREVAGGAALDADARDAAGLARAVRVLLEDDVLRSEHIRRGLRRAAQFSWERCAQETAAVIDEALRRR